MSKIDVMWVGLSAKNDKAGNRLAPLDSSSNSGKVINMIETRHKQLNFYRTNLVKYAPLDNCGKLRYPSFAEMETAMPDLICEFEKYQPKIVFLLGERVGRSVQRYLSQNCISMQATFDTIYHPSYVYIYKRKQLEEYICKVSARIENVAF